MERVEQELRTSSVCDRPPMIPEVVTSSLVYCTDLQLERHAENELLVAQVLDSCKCWVSHLRDVKRFCAECEELFDSAPALDIPTVAAPKLRQLEAETSFYLHLQRDEPACVLRLLRLVPHAKPVLEELHLLLEETKHLNGQFMETSTLMSTAAAYFPGGEWPCSEIADAVKPLFSSLRALFMCTEVFGSKHHRRFVALIVYVVQRTLLSVHDYCHDCLDRIIQSPKCALQVAGELVAAQDSVVSIQEAYHVTRIAIVENSIDPAAAETIFLGVDDEALFSPLEWQYHRLTALHVMADALKKDSNKIGSKLTDSLAKQDLLDPTAVTQEFLLKEVENIETKEAPNPSAVLERMGVKAMNANMPVPFAPRLTYDELTTAMTINVAFNPPVVTIIGGPVSEKTLDAATKALPLCCSNTTVSSSRSALSPAVFKPYVIGQKRPKVAVSSMIADAAHGHKSQTALSATAAEAILRQQLLTAQVAQSDTAAVDDEDDTNNAVFVQTVNKQNGPCMRMEIPEQFCDSDIHQSHFLQTLLDLLESEQVWSLTDTHAHSEREGDRDVHTLFFRRVREWDIDSDL